MINSFTGGEVSPRVLGRTDLGSYDSSVKEMVNCYPFIHGGVTRRKGFRHITALPTHNSYAPKLIRFVFDKNNSYLLIVHSGKMLFIKQGNVIGGGTPVELAVPYLDSELDELRFAQQENILIIVHPNHVPKRLARISDTSWTLTDISFVSYAVTDNWFKTTATDIKIVSDGDISTKYDAGEYWEWTTSGSTVTVDPVLKTSGGSLITTPPGACVVSRVDNSAGNGVWKATCVYSDADRQEWQVRAPDGSYPTLTWSVGAYPQSVTFYQQRLWFGGSTTEPETLWASKVADYENFTVGSLDNDALRLPISSSENSPIIHLTKGANALLPLTSNVEFAVTSTTGAITPFNRSINEQTSHGSTDIAPLRIGSDTVFVDESSRKVRAIYFDINQSQNQAEDITLMAQHITGNGIVDLAYAKTPEPILWAAREDGVLLTGAYDRKQSVNGWARHYVDGLVKRVVTVPEPDSSNVYTCVERTVNGTTAFYIEELGVENLDRYITATDATAKSVWSGFDHLEGETVSVLADGFVHADVNVAGGTVTLTGDANEVVVGKNYENYVTLLHPNVVANGQTSQGRSISIDKLSARYQNTIGSFVTTPSGQSTLLPFTTFGETLFNEPSKPYTGDKVVNLAGWSENNTLKIGQRMPYDWTLLAVVMRVTLNDM